MSPSFDTVQQCRSQCLPGDTVVLLDRGVELLDAADDAWLHTALVSVVDCQARGLTCADTEREVDDRRLVDLVRRHEQILSWW